MLAQDTHAKIVQELLGHSSIRVTMGIYSHVSPTLQQDAVDRLSQRLKQVDESLENPAPPSGE